MSSVAKEVFQVLLRYDYTVKLYDADDMAVIEPREARRMFATAPNLMVSLDDADDDSSIKLLFGKSTHANDINGLMQALRTAATKYNMTFEPKQHGKEIDAKDYQNLASVTEALRKHDMHEGMYGTSRSSYLQLGGAKMIVQHTGRIDTSRPSARGRDVAAIFIESRGARYTFPSTDVRAARAMTRHLAEGGKFADASGRAIAAPPVIDRSTLAENNPVVRGFLNWVNRFTVERALLEFNDPYDPAEAEDDTAASMAIEHFDPADFIASSVFHDMLGGRTATANDADPTGEDRRLSKDEVMAALRAYVGNFIQIHSGTFEDGYHGDTESIARAVYDQALSAVEQEGFTVEDDAMLLDDADGMASSELTREDILLPNHNQGKSFGRAVSKAVVHDDPANPDAEHLPNQGYTDRLRTLAGIHSGRPA